MHPSCGNTEHITDTILELVTRHESDTSLKLCKFELTELADAAEELRCLAAQLEEARQLAEEWRNCWWYTDTTLEDPRRVWPFPWERRP